jgi:hypothetical protein
MGKLILLLLIIVVVVVLLGGWGLFLENRKERSSLGLRGSKKKIAALEASRSRQTAVLQEIHDIAQAEVTIGTSDPMFDVISRKAAAVLIEENRQ